MKHVTVARTNWAKLLGWLYGVPLSLLLAAHFVFGRSWDELFDQERWANARPFIGSPILGQICAAICVIGAVVITYRNVRARGQYLTTSEEGIWILGKMKARRDQLKGGRLELQKRRLSRSLRTPDGRVSLNVSYANVNWPLLRDVLLDQFDCDLSSTA